MRVEDLTPEAREAVAAWLRQRADSHDARASAAAGEEGLELVADFDRARGATLRDAAADLLVLTEGAPRVPAPGEAEHARLAEAASALVEAVDPDYVGDLPAALSALASALSLGHDPTERLRALRE